MRGSQVRTTWVSPKDNVTTLLKDPSRLLDHDSNVRKLLEPVGMISARNNSLQGVAEGCEESVTVASRSKRGGRVQRFRGWNELIRF